ncbi:MAG: ATP-binding protein [Gemmataceae bacterium]|nr:ATP-binding protein [Gemmataceae bacterium]
MADKTENKRRGFKVSARAILQLGGELISSDGIAFYELIKNAFDAGSGKVFVDVVMRLPLEIIQEILDRFPLPAEARERKAALRSVKETLSRSLFADAPDAEQWLTSLEALTTEEELRELLAEANSITFRDLGKGMTLQELEDIYLTVGTPNRLTERARLRTAGDKKVVLGEKGIGRLSAMRLGGRLLVETTTADEERWNRLEIDWAEFGRDLDLLLDEVDIVPMRGAKKAKAGHGTTIRITALNTTWSASKLRKIATDDLSRFTDPFAEKSMFPIHLRYNTTPIPIPRMSDLLREHAHAIVEATLSVEKTKRQGTHVTLAGTVDYLFSGATNAPLRGRSYSFRYSDDEVASLLPTKEDADLTLDAVARLGPFTMQCYWYNRRLLKKIEVNDDVLDLKSLVRPWSGGLMLYRNGFRVPPYGGPDDDWLNLDRGALASQGYKVNRAQLVGKVDISIDENPRLVDQTNREGLRDCPEKRALAALLKHVLEMEFRAYINEVDEELRDRERISFGELGEELSKVEDRINESLSELAAADIDHPDLKIGKLTKRLQTAYQTVVMVVGQMQESVEAAEDEKARLLHLAALGLTIEKLAHELNRATKHALAALRQIAPSGGSSELKRTASLQLQSLQKRLQNLDPLLTPTKQRKEEFDLIKEVRAVLDGFEARFQRHGIKVKLVEKSDKPVIVKLVRAMLIQVLENLVDNSVYWLTVQGRRKDQNEQDPQITVTVDGQRNVLEVTDNGPGIAPENRERIFRPFYTLKPAGEGKGLGLYISREIAEYHGGTLTLSDKGLRSTGRLHTFVLDFTSGRV